MPWPIDGSNCSLREQEEGETPAACRVLPSVSDSSCSTWITPSQIQWVKAAVMLRKMPYMCARIGKSSFQNMQEQSIFHMPLAAHPNRSTDGLLGEKSGHADHASASAQAHRSACSPESIRVQAMPGGHMRLV